jgi:NAD(P)-dependent dehydrogenase (short-subunit alcohol dehydrogenase family)
MTQTIAITGANRGLGLELARHYVSQGHTVIGGCRTPSAADTLHETGAEVIALDMADLDSIQSFALTLSGRPIHALYNSAGVDARAFGADPDKRGALAIGPEAFHDVMLTNVNGPVFLVQRLATNLTAAKGIVVNISSQLGSMEVAAKLGPDLAYCVSKAALNMVTVKLAQAFAADGVRAVTVHPGWLRTDMGGPSADLDPADAAKQIAESVAKLTLADSGRFIRWDGTTHPW